TESNNGDVSGNHGGYDIWVVKLNNTGILWQKCLGGVANDYGSSIKQTIDGGYILMGSTSSSNGDVSGNHGGSDIWVAKLTNLGGIEWQKCLGGIQSDTAASIQQSTDGGYILCGDTSSFDGDVSGWHGADDVWVVKLTNIGVIQWQKCLGGTINDNSKTIQQTTDGGYIIAGNTTSNDGDASGNQGGSDIWIVKLSSFLGLEETSNNNLVSLFPNPVTNVLNLKLENNIEINTYTISNIEGKIIDQGLLNENNTAINVEQLSKGVYFIKVNDNNSIKFIKM
ncbi:T9SS type A sorting domain-containing protein, partial [Flavobacterium sp.]|uniref:T9SS type A sorting domain-containing protein n=1 Tax=Flavobacterium sp. TaxID=239 RepID=UPI00334068EA